MVRRIFFFGIVGVRKSLAFYGFTISCAPVLIKTRITGQAPEELELLYGHQTCCLNIFMEMDFCSGLIIIWFKKKARARNPLTLTFKKKKSFFTGI